MRFNALALAASAIVLGACGGGGEAGNADTTTAAGTTPAATGGAATGTATAMPITGKTHEVKMIAEGNTFRFDPVNITVKSGDGIRFTTISGMPHNFGFNPANIPDDVEAQLRANMPAGSTDLESPFQTAPNESHTLSLGGIKAGKYTVHCTPHLQLGMTGVITVE